MQYKAAVIGCGRIGCGFKDDYRRKQIIYGHASAYSSFKNTTLVALCDIDFHKLQTNMKKYDVRGYKSHEEMLKQEKPDIVSICTSPDTHCDIIHSCLRHGVKAIYCEKPIDTSLEKAKIASAACREKNVVLAINHQRRFGKFHQLFAKAVQAGVIGNIQQISVNYVAGISNTGTHFIDLLRFYLGKEVEWVYGIKSINECPNHTDFNIDGWVAFENGPLASIQSINAFGILELIFTTDLGRFTVNMHHPFTTEPALVCEKVVENNFFEGATKLEKTTSFPGLEWAPNERHNDMWRAVEQIVECLEEKKYNIVSDGSSGIAALEVIEALIQSMENNIKIFIGNKSE